MADDDLGKLEPPSLSMGRWRRKKAAAPVEEPVEAPVEEEPRRLVELGETPEETDGDDTIEAPVAVAAEPEKAPPLFTDERPAAPAEDPPATARTTALRIPALNGPTAAAAAGLLVGAFLVATTLAGQELCTVARGTSSCGTPGYLLLIAILIVGVVLGSQVLAFAGAEEPGSTSTLAIALFAVLALVLVGGSLLAWWMILVAPLLSVACYSLSHLVTTRFAAEPIDA